MFGDWPDWVNPLVCSAMFTAWWMGTESRSRPLRLSTYFIGAAAMIALGAYTGWSLLGALTADDGVIQWRRVQTMDIIGAGGVAVLWAALGLWSLRGGLKELKAVPPIGNESSDLPKSAERLIGKWSCAPGGGRGLAPDETAIFEFRRDGCLIYSIESSRTKQSMLLTYRADDNHIITDQPSSPSEQRTGYRFDPDGGLVLSHGDVENVFHRVG